MSMEIELDDPNGPRKRRGRPPGATDTKKRKLSEKQKVAEKRRKGSLSTGKKPRGRPPNPAKAALFKELGITPHKSYTLRRLVSIKKQRKKQAAYDKTILGKETTVTQDVKAFVNEIANHTDSNMDGFHIDEIAGPPPKGVSAAELDIPYESIPQDEDPLAGLSDRNKRIARLRMRGLSQGAIARIEGISQPAVSVALKTIKEWQVDRGANVEQKYIVGSASTLYEEVEQMAWQMYHTPDATVGDKAKCLGLVMGAREKHTKLLMDLGLIKKTSQEVTVTHEVSPFLQGWKNRDKTNLASSVLVSQLSALPEPSPEIIDGDVEADAEEDGILVESTDLQEPEPDELELD